MVLRWLVKKLQPENESRGLMFRTDVGYQVLSTGWECVCFSKGSLRLLFPDLRTCEEYAVDPVLDSWMFEWVFLLPKIFIFQFCSFMKVSWRCSRGRIATINVSREQSDRPNKETMRREWKLKEKEEVGTGRDRWRENKAVCSPRRSELVSMYRRWNRLTIFL
jgi:hypothetical protein